MSVLDFNTAEKQRAGDGEFDLIPNGTIAPVRLLFDGIKTAKTGTEGSQLEFVITEGEFAKRRIWQWMTTGNSSDKAISITQSFLRGILESAYGVNPDDDSDQAMEARRLASWDDLHGLEFVARIGIEKSKDPQYSDKNKVMRAITPNEDDYAGFRPATVSSVKKSAPKPQADSTGAKRSWGNR